MSSTPSLSRRDAVLLRQAFHDMDTLAIQEAMDRYQSHYEWTALVHDVMLGAVVTKNTTQWDWLEQFKFHALSIESHLWPRYPDDVLWMMEHAWAKTTFEALTFEYPNKKWAARYLPAQTAQEQWGPMYRQWVLTKPEAWQRVIQRIIEDGGDRLLSQRPLGYWALQKPTPEQTIAAACASNTPVFDFDRLEAIKPGTATFLAMLRSLSLSPKSTSQQLRSFFSTTPQQVVLNFTNFSGVD